MQDVFLLCLVLGAVVLIGQILLGLIGMTGELPDSLPHSADDGAELLSVRTVSAGATMFGAVGFWAGSAMPGIIAFPIAVIAGIAAAVATAYLTRQMMRFESDGSLRIENAVGESATVYLPVPAHRRGSGKIQFKLQGRTVELAAIANEADAIPTGAPVIVIGVIDGDTVEVTPTPLIEGIDV